ncbi:MAG: iron-containing alcohol dehydrogenase family protein [Rubrobacteraceae bacterium]
MPGEQFMEIPPSGPVFFGPGEAARTGGLVRGLGASHAFVVCDAGIVASGVLDPIRDSLEKENLSVQVFDRVTPNPDTAGIEAGSGALREHGLADTVVVAAGGGSSLDSAKGIALHAANPGPVGGLHFTRDQDQPGLPVVALPTTAGTGSETNYFGVITDPGTGRKFYIGHPSVRPVASILDPLLTVGLPPKPTAATGMDALVHALEALVSRAANPYADGISLHVIRLVNHWLPVVLDDGANLKARSQLLLASHMAGRAFSSGTGLGLCHGLAHAVSARTHAAHGVALTVVLPHVLRFNLPVSSEKLALAAEPLGIAQRDEAEGTALSAILAIEELGRGVVEERTLTDLGVTESMAPTLVQDTMQDPVLGNTPRMPEEEDVRRILAVAFSA